MVLMVKNLPVNAGDVRDGGLIPESGRSPGGGNGNPLQYSRLKISMDRGAWGATVHGVGKNQISLSMRTNTSAGAAGEKRGSHRAAWDFQETSGKGDDAMLRTLFTGSRRKKLPLLPLGGGSSQVGKQVPADLGVLVNVRWLRDQSREGKGFQEISIK